MRSDPPTAENLLDLYRQYPVKKFLLIYGLANLPPGDDFAPDEHGRALMGFAFDYELTDIGGVDEPLCIRVHADARKEDVIALLRRAADELEHNFYKHMIPENQERFWQAAHDLLNAEDQTDSPTDGEEPPGDEDMEE